MPVLDQKHTRNASKLLFLLKLHPLSLLLPPRPLGSSAPAIVGEGAHVGAGASVGAAVVPSAANGIAAHGAAA